MQIKEFEECIFLLRAWFENQDEQGAWNRGRWAIRKLQDCFDCEYKFAIGETVQMIMGRACLSHFDGALAKITERSKTSAGREVYRMNPTNQKFQQNVEFDVGCLRKLDPEPEPLSDIHVKQISISEKYIPQKIEMLDRRLKEQIS